MTVGTAPGSQRLRRPTVVRYAIGSIGTGGFNTLPGLVLLYFLTDSLGIAALAAGLIVSGAKIWDVVIDPTIGALSDRSAARTGSRRLFLRLGAATLPVFFVLTFAAPASWPTWLAGVAVAVAFIAAATAFSLFQIPYLALAAEITDSYTERTRLQTARLVLLTVAILIFGGVFPGIRQAFDSTATGYLVMAIVSAVLIGAAMWIASGAAESGTGSGGRENRTGSTDGTNGTRTGLTGESVNPLWHYRRAVAAVRSSAPFRALYFSFILKSLAMGLLLAVGQYVATWVLQREAAISLLFVALIGPAIVVTPIWGWLSTRYGKEPLVYVAGGIFAVATLSLVALIWVPGPWLFGPFVLAGIAYAGLQALPLSILPDVIAYENQRQGAKQSGVFTGVWTAGETAGLALGPLILAVLLQFTGYISSTDASVSQPESAVAAIVLALSVIPAVLVLASLVVFRGYRLRRVDIDSTTPASVGVER